MNVVSLATSDYVVVVVFFFFFFFVIPEQTYVW